MQHTVTARDDLAVDGDGDMVDDGHCNSGQWQLRLLATAAVTGGYGGCNGTQRQAKSAAATATATTCDSSCDGGQQQEKAAAKMGDSLFVDDG